MSDNVTQAASEVDAGVQERWQRTRRRATIVMVASLVALAFAVPMFYGASRDMVHAQKEQARLDGECAQEGPSCSYGEYLRQKDEIDAEGIEMRALGALLLGSFSGAAALGGYGFRSGFFHFQRPKKDGAQ